MMLKIGNEGFTLIEVLVASVILFVGLGAVLKAYSLAVVAMGAASDKLAISQLLQQKASQLDSQISGSGDVLFAGGGRQMMDGGEYLWRVESTRQVLTPEVSVLCAAIEVARVSGGQASSCACEWAQFQKKEQAR